MEPTPWEIHQADEHLTLYSPTLERPYLRMVLEHDSPLGLRDVFVRMVHYSTQYAGRTVLCRDFLPQLHLYLYSVWREPDGMDALLEDWRRTELLIKHWIDDWGPRGVGIGGTANLRHGHALITPTPEPELKRDLALEIVREYGWLT